MSIFGVKNEFECQKRLNISNATKNDGDDRSTNDKTYSTIQKFNEENRSSSNTAGKEAIVKEENWLNIFDNNDSAQKF